MDPATPSKEELRDAYAAALAYALKKTGSKARADDALQDASELLLTTRKWDRTRGPLDVYLIGIVRSVLSHARASVAQDTAHDADQVHVEGAPGPVPLARREQQLTRVLESVVRARLRPRLLERVSQRGCVRVTQLLLRRRRRIHLPSLGCAE